MSNLLFLILTFISGFITSFFIFPKIPQEKTEITKQSTLQSTQTRTKIIYKDKIRTIKVECPSQILSLKTQEEKKEVIYPGKFSHTFKSGLQINPFFPKDVNQYEFSVGYFIHKNISIDAQTNIKFDMIKVGVSFYF